MSSPKIFGLTLGFIFLVFASLVVFGNYLEPPKSESVRNDKESAASQGTNSQKNELMAGLPERINVPPSPELAEATLNISKKISDSITGLNVGGFTKIDDQDFIKALNPQTIVDQVLQRELEEIERLSRAETEPAIEIPAEQIIVGADKRQEEDYLRLFARILEKNSAAVSASKISSPADFWRIVEAYKKTADEFRRLSVPETLLQFHKKELAFLVWEIETWGKLAGADRAPLEAAAALKRHEQTRQEFLALKQEIGGYIKENKLAVQWQ